METQKLPFEITPEIKRYLEDIVFLHEEWLADKDVLYMIEGEIFGEVSTPKRWNNDEKFWEYLEKQKAVKEHYPFDVENLAKIIKMNHPIQQIAIARTHTNKKNSIERFWAKTETWKKDLEKIVDLSIESCRDGRDFIKPYTLLTILDFKPIEKLLEKIKEKTITDESNKNIEYTKLIDGNFKVRFDSQNGVVRYGDEVLKFQKGLRGERPRLLLFKKLWPERKHIKNGVIKAIGRPTPPEMLAVQLDIASDSHAFNQNRQVKDRFFDLIKGINRALKSKNIPAKIERINGIQLVVIEK